MSARKDIDRAVGNLIKWSSRPEWAERKRAVFDEHVCGAAARCDLEVDDLLGEVEDTGRFPTVFGAVFEDFASRPPTADAPNVVDEYLKRRGSRESPAGRRYLAQLRDSVLSLYEVVDVDPGRSVIVRDLLRGAAPILVHEKLGTKQLVRWDRLAARVIETGQRRGFTGGLMPFAREAADGVIDLLERAPAPVREWVAAQARDGGGTASSSDRPDVVDAFVRERCASFTEIWLVDLISRRRAPLPELVNRDGEPLLFGEVRFAVEDRNPGEIEDAMNGAAGWDRAAADLPTWTWFDEGPPSRPASRGMSIQTQTEDGRPILGAVELRDRTLVFTANSRERTERGTVVLESLLGDRIGRPVTSYQSPRSTRARDEGTDDEEPVRAPGAEIDEATKRRLIGQVKDEHYRRVLDEPVPALGGKSPRACARSKRDRDKVVKWLKELENLELRAAARNDPGAYDVEWIWAELGLGEFRS